MSASARFKGRMEVLYKKDPPQDNGQSSTHIMSFSLLVRSALVVVLAGASLQQTAPQIARAPSAPQFSPGYQGLGTSQGFRGQGSPVYGGQGYPGSDSGYGFQIVDTPDRYGYVSNYPGGRTSFFLLGPNRGPGQQSGWRGSSLGNMGSYQPGTYRPNSFRSDSYRPDSYRADSYRPDNYRPDSYRPGTNSLDGWRQSRAW